MSTSGPKTSPAPTPSVPELPHVDDVLDAVKDDLGTSRGLQQRLLTTQDTLLASALTVAGLFGGFGFSNHNRPVALVAVPFVLALGALDAKNWTLFRRVSNRIRGLERILHAHVVAIREQKTVGPQAVERLRKSLDGYDFGTELSIDKVAVLQIFKSNWRRLRPWLYVLIAATLLLAGLLWVRPNATQKPICVLTSGRGIAEMDAAPSAVSGEVTLVPCPPHG